MFSSDYFDRFQRCMKVEEAPRRRSLENDFGRIVSMNVANSALQSSSTARQLGGLFAQELDIRASLAWKIAVRILRDTQLGSDGDLRNDLKGLMRSEITRVQSALEVELNQHLQRFKLPTASLADRAQEAQDRHDIEIDLFMDARDKNDDKAQAASAYHFYGTVGAVQLGANAVAHVTQHLTASDKERLLSALQSVEDVLKHATQIENSQRAELLQIASETRENLNAESPNNTKLRMTLDVLATAVQGIASGGAAYEALRGAMITLGM